MRCVRVVVADRHPIVRRGLSSLLSAERDFRVVACCRDGLSCIEAIRMFRPEVAILDWSLPGIGGSEILAAVSSENIPTRLVFFTAPVRDIDRRMILATGSNSIISKDIEPEILLHALRQSANVEGCSVPHNPGLPREPANGDAELNVLTDRERQIMRLVSEGLPNKEIGRRLNITDGTIKVHLHHIFQKLEVSNRTVLAAIAISQIDKIYEPRGNRQRASLRAAFGSRSTISDKVRSVRGR